MTTRSSPRGKSKLTMTSVMPKTMDEILAHQWNKYSVLFLVQWNLGDTTWEPYSECKDLTALDRYLELLGIPDNEWRKLLRKASTVKKSLDSGPMTSELNRQVGRQNW